MIVVVVVVHYVRGWEPRLSLSSGYTCDFYDHFPLFLGICQGSWLDLQNVGSIDKKNYNMM